MAEAETSEGKDYMDTVFNSLLDLPRNEYNNRGYPNGLVKLCTIRVMNPDKMPERVKEFLVSLSIRSYKAHMAWKKKKENRRVLVEKDTNTCTLMWCPRVKVEDSDGNQLRLEEQPEN